ncbi:MAG: glycosyltransferase [Deltaproteobacteria bacterium]|nr:glycosyltransferase [Deltaproteobacteria bacterium]MCB9487427.1 glycosyltransferase [Deltaproteobacteria bacterium]
MSADSYPYDLSIVVPVYNEESRLEDGLRRMMDFGRTFDGKLQIVVSDDGSRDRTAAMAREILADYPHHLVLDAPVNRGKGHAVKVGMLAARGAYRLFTDIDLSVPIETANRFYKLGRDGAPVVIGTRKVRQANVEIRQPFYRELMGGVFRWTSRFLCAPSVTDFTCGFKLFNAQATRAIFRQSVIERWSFDAEIMFIAHRMDYQIIQVPVVWRNSEDSRVRVGVDAINSFVELMQIRAHDLMGQYSYSTTKGDPPDDPIESL